MARTEDGLFVNFLRLEKFNAIHFVSASLIMNTTRDLRNCLEIIWRCSKLKRVFNHIKAPESIAEVYAKDYDPVKKGAIFHKGYKGGDVQAVTAFVLEYDWIKQVPVWIANPAWFRDHGEDTSHDDRFASVVVRRVLKVLQRRRTITTHLLMPGPDGGYIFPGSDIPETTIVMEEVAYVGEYAKDQESDVRSH